jgi:hypothetical protein
MYQEISAMARDMLNRKMSESLEPLANSTQITWHDVNGSGAD